MNILFVRPQQEAEAQFIFLEKAAINSGSIAKPFTTIEEALEELTDTGKNPDIIVSGSFELTGFYPLARKAQELHIPLIVLSGVPEHVQYEAIKAGIPSYGITYREKTGLRARSFMGELEQLLEQHRVQREVG